MPSATLLLAFVLLLQVAACRPSSSSLGDDRSGRSLLRVAAWPWYSSHRLPVSSSSSWNAFSLPVAARLGAAPLRVAPVAAPVAAPAWELPRVVAPIAQKQAASDYYMVSLASPASGVSHLVRYELATPLPATPHPATPHPATPHPATPSWLRLYGTPLYDMVESVQSAARPHLIINRAATRRGPPSPTWVPSPSPASPVAAVQRGDRPQDGATGPAAGTTPSAQHTKATTDVSEAGSTVYVFTTSAVAATDDAPHDAASGVATLSAWDDQWTSNSAVSGVQPTVETTVATRQPVFETSIATHEPTETTAATHQPVFETSIATHEPTETTAATHQLTETSVVPTWPAATTIVTTDIGETTATAYKTAETTAATHQPAETAVTTDVAETTAATPNRIDTTAAPSKWSETTAWPERTETTAALLLEQAVTTVAVEVPVFTTNISLSVNLVTEPVEVVTTGNFDPESTPAVTATETTFPWSEPALTADQTDSVTVISVSATDVPLMTTFQPAYNGSVTTDLLDPATAAFTNEPVVTTELPSDVGSSVTTTQPEDEEAETVTSQSSTVSFVSTDSDLPTSYDLDTIEIEINRRTVAPATTDFPDGAPSTTAAPTTTEAYSSLEAEDSTPSWTPTDVTDADQSEEPATDAAYSSSPAPEVFSTTSATTEVVSTTSAPTETVSTASALPEDVSTYTESIGTTTAEAGSGVWTEDAMTSDPAAVGYTASTDGFSTASFSTTMADASTTVSSEATTTAGATPTEASTYLVDVLTTSPADVDPTALEMTASAPQATFPWSTDTTPQTLTVMTYPLPGTSKSPFVAPLTLRPTSAPVTDFNYYDGVAFDDGVVVGGGSPADSYIPDYDSRVDEYDGDYFADAAERQRPPLSPPLTSDTKGLEIASLVRETPPAPDSHRRSDVLPEDDVDDESNEVGSASTAWSSTPRPAATTHKYGDSFEGQMLRRMVPLVVRQLRLGHLSAEDTVRLRYIFGPIWPEVEQMARAVEAGRGRRDAGRYPHYKKWTGDVKPGEGGSSRRGGHVRRPTHGPARRRPQKHTKGAGHKRGPKRGHKGDGHHAQDARLDTHRQPKHAVHRRHHPHHAEDHQVRPKRDLSPEDDAADDEDYYREDNDEDYVVDHRDDYDADEEEEEGDDEDEGFDSPSVMELHFRGMQGEGPLGRRRRPARRRVHG